MIYLTENGAYFEEDYKALEASRCEAHVSVFNCHQRDISRCEAHVIQGRAHAEAAYRQEQYDIWN